jgi:chromosome segregation ATPase
MAASPQDKAKPNVMNGTAELNAAPKSTSLAKQILALLFALTIGTLIGGYVTSSLLESEYQSILAQLRANYQLSLSETKEEHKICQDDLLEQKKSYTEAVSSNDDGCKDELKTLKSQWRHEELLCQQEVEREMLWSHKAYEDSTAAIAKATNKLQALKQEIGSLKSDLVNKHAEWEVAVSNLSSTQMQREEARQKLDQITLQLADVEGQYHRTQKSLSTLGEELERRDIERAECDKIHRELDSCKRTLQKSLEGTTDGCTTSLDLLKDEKNDLSRQLEVMKTQNEKIIGESEFTNRRSAHVEKQLEGANALLSEFETERDALKVEIKTINDKIREKDRLSVLHR